MVRMHPARCWLLAHQKLLPLEVSARESRAARSDSYICFLTSGKSDHDQSSIQIDAPLSTHLLGLQIGC